MGQYSAIQTEGHLNQVLASLLRRLLEAGVVNGVVAPARQPHHKIVMQTLITDPARLDSVDPFAPVVFTNAARLVASLTFQPTGQPLAAVLRSCEVRAFIELVKLHQGRVDDLLLIGVDCHGRYENTDFRRLVEQDDDLTMTFLKGACNGGGTKSAAGPDVTNACKVCEHPVADNVDLRLCVFGADPSREIWVEWVTDKGQRAREALQMEASDAGPEGREAVVEQLVERRIEQRDRMFDEFRARTEDMDGLAEAVSGCINCYNCRVACPVCYCRECVFVTDTFRHDSAQYMVWARNRGQLKLPTDTVFYHMTRMIHMSTLCVGCGQCTSACPNDIPVMELFRTVADKTQARFDYAPGRSLEDAQPLAIFHDEEFGDVTGQVK